ncbi:HNH endonuclease [Psychrobacter ciconiae]|uniref:HNH endonuclease n=1 Tax=Psychrobacter ciconiae TaxID=1553449 RepID=UPI00191B40EF|nr:HNH endonuclease [Psychrobacter ciconiae]
MNLSNLPAPTFDFQIKFLKYIQWLLESGSYTSTYKFALLMSLVNVAIESEAYGNSTLFISYEALAEQFIKLYWDQALPYIHDQDANSDSLGILYQNLGSQAIVITSISALQSKQANINKAKMNHANDWTKMRKTIAQTIHKNPAKFLQSPENVERTFLYHYDEKNKNGITLNCGIAYCLAHFSNIIFKLCQQYWTEFVRNNKRNQHLFNQNTDLQGFLFKQSRQNLASLVPMLIDIQDCKCFYCAKPLKKDMEVDHFIPWSKYPNDTAHNFVLADRGCNNAKRDYLADIPFYERWQFRNQTYHQDITSFAIEKGFTAHLATSEKIGKWAYNLAKENQDLVWQPPKNFKVIETTLDVF